MAKSRVDSGLAPGRHRLPPAHLFKKTPIIEIAIAIAAPISANVSAAVFHNEAGAGVVDCPRRREAAFNFKLKPH
jgi:hypothetical protein